MLERRSYGFAPATPEDEELLADLPVGTKVGATLRRKKSPAMLRYYWAIVDQVADGIGWHKTVLSDQLICETRRLIGFEDGSNSVKWILQRISHMDYIELRDFVTAAMAVIEAKYVDPTEMPELHRVATQRAGTSLTEAIRELEEWHRKKAAKSKSES